MEVLYQKFISTVEKLGLLGEGPLLKLYCTCIHINTKISSEDFLKVFYIGVDRSSGEGGPISNLTKLCSKGHYKKLSSSPNIPNNCAFIMQLTICSKIHPNSY